MKKRRKMSQSEVFLIAMDFSPVLVDLRAGIRKERGEKIKIRLLP